MKIISLIPNLHLFVLLFLVIGTHIMIHRLFSIIDSFDLSGINYLIADFIQFLIISIIYVIIYYILVRVQILRNSH